MPGLNKPLGTAVAGGQKHALVAAFLAQHTRERGNGENAGRSAEEPFSTLTASGSLQQVVTAFLAQHNGQSIGSDFDVPSPL